jgi:hypothetical protein
MKRVFFWIAAVLCFSPAAMTMQKGKTPKTAASPRQQELTEEDKEVLSQRELLENLELLRNFEKIQYLELLSEKSPVKTKDRQTSKTPAKNNEPKNKTP